MPLDLEAIKKEIHSLPKTNLNWPENVLVLVREIESLRERLAKSVCGTCGGKFNDTGAYGWGRKCQTCGGTGRL